MWAPFQMQRRDPGTPQTSTGPRPILARHRALSHSAPVPLLLCPHQISCQRGPQQRKDVTGPVFPEWPHGWEVGLPSPGSQAQAQRAEPEPCQRTWCPPVPRHRSLPSQGLGATAPWRLPPPRASSTGLPPRGSTAAGGERGSISDPNVRLTLLNRARASVLPVTSILRFLLPREPRGTSACVHVLTSGSPR